MKRQVIAFALSLLIALTAWAAGPARIKIVGIREAPTMREALQNDVKKICRLLGVDPVVVKMPGIYWLPDGEAVRQRCNMISGALEMGELLGLYVPASNRIYLSKQDYRPYVLWHELAHCIISHSDLRFTLPEEERKCDWVADQMERER